MKVIKLAAGLAVGYVLGSRAGRDKYEQIVAAGRKVQNHPAVARAQQKATALLDAGATRPRTPATRSGPTLSHRSPPPVRLPVPHNTGPRTHQQRRQRPSTP
jgi:hypothetical protein